MNGRSDRLIAQLDRAAALTGVPRLLDPAREAPGRRVRWLPLSGLALAGWGLWLHATGGRAAPAALLAAWLVAMLGLWRGPLRRSPARPWPDEFQADLARRGHLAGLAVCFALTLIGCGAMALLGARRGAPPPALDAPTWVGLIWFLLAVELNVATLVASWRMPPPLPDED